jgi:hypothetical protein
MPISTYLAEEMGHVSVTPTGPFVAGAFTTITLVYTAGKFGIDDTGVLKVSWRTTSDMAKPQFTDPAAPNYTTVVASNGAKLDVRFDLLNIRPWLNTILIRVGRGYLKAGETITVVLGERGGGSPGYRMQTNVESPAPLKVFVDAFATYDFVEVPAPPLDIVAGPPTSFRAIAPTLVATGAPFRLAIVPFDLWGNASESADVTLTLRPSGTVAGLPETVTLRPGAGPAVLDGLSCAADGIVRIAVLDGDRLVATSNPIVVADGAATPYWADLHGQSGETIGMGSADDYFRFARDRAFIDVVGHQGNDFQITPAIWSDLNGAFAAFNEPGRFVVMPGYEWSGNTGMGGDRNVMFLREGERIHRSSHALVGDWSDLDADRHTAAELFEGFAGRDDVLCVAHVGGRYADLSKAHDGTIERAVEVHSSWGTFEWLLHDAFALGHRVGVTCGSDDHKGRPGAAHPGASSFGALGGLTCLVMPELTREAVFACLRQRRHYGTTGSRVHIALAAELPDGSIVFDDDPALGPTEARAARRASMGDVVKPSGPVRLVGRVVASAPIVDVTVFAGTRVVQTLRPYPLDAPSRRLRLQWQGAEYRGRGRETFWDGTATVEGATFASATAFNFLNPEKRLSVTGQRELAWTSVTTGNMAGIDLVFAEPPRGRLVFTSCVIDTSFDLCEASRSLVTTPAGGLDRKVSLFPLPLGGGARELDFDVVVTPDEGRDTPLYIRLTQEDGHQAWTSPIYLMPAG